MKRILHLLFGLIICASVSAQNYTMNWNSSFSPAWANGATTGTAFNIGGSGTNCTVNINKSGGAFASSAGISAPTVSNSLVTVPGSSNNLMVALDYSSSAQYTDITFTFTAAVYNLNFYVADIDRLDNTSNNYFDRLAINGSIGMTSVQPVITKYDPTTDPNFLIISGNVARVNTASGMAGNTASNATDQKGTIKVSFNGMTITSFTIRYDNYPGAAADPGVQYIGIGNLNFRNNFPLAVQLTSFSCESSNGKNLLNWETANENKVAYYAIEKSDGGSDFREVGRVPSRNSTASSEYNFTDNNTIANSSYRLKIINADGSFSYSKTVLLRSINSSEIKIFPCVFTSSLKLRMQSQKEETVSFALLDLSGKTLWRDVYKATKGVNEFSMQLPANLSRGQYYIVQENSCQSFGVIRQ